MAKAFDFKITGLDKLQKRLDKLPDNLKKEIDVAIKETVVEVNGEQVQRVPKDRSEIAQSIGFIKEKGQKDIISYLNFANAPHALFMEFGTRKKFKAIPGVDTPDYKKTAQKDGKGFYESILAWVKRKGIAGRFSVKTQKKLNSKADQEREEQAAMAIYLHILRHGVKPQPFFFQPFLEKKDQLVNKIAAILKKI